MRRTRKRLIPRGALKQIRELAAAGAREGAIARRLGFSPPRFSRLKDEDDRVREAIDRGRDELERELIHRVREPALPDDPEMSVSERIALMRARQFGAVTLGNSLFGWRTDAAPDSSKVNVTITLPAPAKTITEYQARITSDEVTDV